MGRGSKPYESNVIKQRTSYTKISNGGIGGGTGRGVSSENQEDSCLFSFNLKITIDTKDIIFEINDPVALVPTSPNQIGIFAKGINVTNYDGNFKIKLLKCIENNYVYTGKIDSVKNERSKQIVDMSVHGQGR